MTKSSQFANVAIGLCCFVVTALALRREFWPVPVANADTGARARYVEKWERLLSVDATMGSLSSSVKIIEFVDFECPFCADLAVRLSRLQKEYPGELSLTLRHRPIPGHKFARQAAMAFECAKPQRKEEELYNALFAKQDSLGLRSLREYARDAGIGDLNAFEECSRASKSDRIEEDIKFADRLGVNATPTLLVNGWMLSFPPSDERFREILESHRNGQPWKPDSGDTLRVKW